MSAPVLLNEYKMKKQAEKLKKEGEAPVTLAFMREFRAELMSKFSEIDARFDRVDARFEQMEARFEQVDARFEQMEARFDQVDARFEEMEARFEQVDARIKSTDSRFDQMDAKIEQFHAETQAAIHQVKLLVEEQNLRNKQAYDGYAVTYGALQDFKSKVKPECLKD